jgi:hypothetical protein
MITICYPKDVYRRNNSRNGNPSYRVKVLSDWFYTKVDAGYVYGIDWHTLIDKRCAIEYHETPTGRKIIDSIERI